MHKTDDRIKLVIVGLIVLVLIFGTGFGILAVQMNDLQLRCK